MQNTMHSLVQNVNVFMAYMPTYSRCTKTANYTELEKQKEEGFFIKTFSDILCNTDINDWVGEKTDLMITWNSNRVILKQAKCESVFVINYQIMQNVIKISVNI